MKEAERVTFEHEAYFEQEMVLLSDHHRIYENNKCSVLSVEFEVSSTKKNIKVCFLIIK